MGLGTQSDADCDSAYDFTNRIREELSSGKVTKEKLSQLSINIQTLGRNCPVSKNVADIWYLRGRIEAKLGNTKDAAAYDKKAEELNSVLRSKNFDPFMAVISTDPPKHIGKKYALLVGIDRSSTMRAKTRRTWRPP